MIASTSEIYGKASHVPFREDDDRVLGSTAVTRWSYSMSKAIDEHFAFAYAAKGLPVSIVRYFNSYGPRIDERGYGSVVANFARQALRGDPITVHGDGKQSRCFTFISDTVAGTLLAGEADGAIGEAFNIGNPHETSVLELAKTMKRLARSKSAIQFVPYEAYYGTGFEDTRRRVPAVDKAKRLLGFTPRCGLEAGLARRLSPGAERTTVIRRGRARRGANDRDAGTDPGADPTRASDGGRHRAGYVGLPLAVGFARAGVRVVGDRCRRRTGRAGINRGESHIPDVPTEMLAPLVQAGRFSAEHGDSSGAPRPTPS